MNILTLQLFYVAVEPFEFDKKIGVGKVTVVHWELSIDEKDLPEAARLAGKRTFRSILIDGQEFEFSEEFTDLHTRCYEKILSGEGFGLEESRKAIDLVHEIREFEENRR